MKFFSKFLILFNFLIIRKFFFVILFTGLTIDIYSNPKEILGLWVTYDEIGGEKSVVEIFEDKGYFFGKIISLREPLDEKGHKKICHQCNGPEKDKPMVGLVIIQNMIYDGEEFSGGSILDPLTGNVYKCRMETFSNGNKLKVRGIFGLFGRTQTWIRK